MNTPGQQALLAIGRRYIVRTLKDLSTLHSDLEKAKAGHREGLPHLAHSAHQISGAAAIFGYEEVSTCATRMARLVAALEEKKRVDPGFSELDTVTLELEKAIRRAAKSRGVQEA